VPVFDMSPKLMVTIATFSSWILSVQPLILIKGIHRSRQFHSSTSCSLNRFLFDPAELDTENDGNTTSPHVTLPKDDYRTLHAAKILSLKNGDTIRCGIVGCESRKGMITDVATVEWKPEGKVKKAEPLKNGDPPGSLQIRLAHLIPADHHPSSTPNVSLILALPRPLQLGRMLPMISQMGVETLVLTAASKVPKDYFGSHLFRKPDLLKDRLIEGLCQAGDVRLPTVQIVRHLSSFLNEEVDRLFPASQYARVIAHPQRPGSLEKIQRIRDIPFPDDRRRKMVIAVGAEGGWQEPEELDLFQTHGFHQITMGSRVLRSDCAVISLLSLAHDACTATIP
jgi:RsmE family RNA methyltransferase